MSEQTGPSHSAFRVLPFLLLLCVIAALIAALDWLTASRIASRSLQAQQAPLRALLPPQCDSDPLADMQEVRIGEGEARVRIAACRQQGELVRQLVMAAPVAGYHGPIELLLGVDPEGGLVAIKVLRHTENYKPARQLLGTDSDWLTALQGMRLEQAGSKTVLQVDAVSGATVSARAVQQALNQSALSLLRAGAPNQAVDTGPASPLN